MEGIGGAKPGPGWGRRRMHGVCRERVPCNGVFLLGNPALSDVESLDLTTWLIRPSGENENQQYPFHRPYPPFFGILSPVSVHHKDEEAEVVKNPRNILYYFHCFCSLFQSRVER